jgi:hypothetical protein
MVLPPVTGLDRLKMPPHWCLSSAFFFQFLICGVFKSCSTLSSHLMGAPPPPTNSSSAFYLGESKFISGICFTCSRQVSQTIQSFCLHRPDYVSLIMRLVKFMVISISPCGLVINGGLIFFLVIFFQFGFGLISGFIERL